MEFLENLLEPLGMERHADTVLANATNVLIALVILIIGFWIAGRMGAVVRGIGKKYEALDDTLFNFLGSLVRYVVLAFVIIAVLNRFGVETTSIVALLGAAGLAVGLALQGAMSNLAAGVMLMIFRPYKVGDFIDAAGNFGNVEEITLFTTVLRTFDHQQIIIPNGKIWGEQIVNHSHHPIRGVELTFGVSYDTDIDKARDVIKKVFKDHPQILDDPEPVVVVSTLNDSSVDFAVRPFVKGEHWFDVRFTVPEMVKKALDEAGIEIPFPHQKVILFKGDE
ncbi:MAG: mechanosensitive ion channel [Hyphomonadaceae bacterium]|nr:mechanosensitive ion channel [Hyphomonadaceae bacterium]